MNRMNRIPQKSPVSFFRCIAFSACVAVSAGAETLERRIEVLLGRMTLEEKILQLHHEGGMNTADNVRLGIPGFMMADGPHGVREGTATAFPAGIAMAATWDTALAFRVGEAMGREFRGKGKDQALGPCLDLCRDPRNGRSPESGGEDPFLISRMATAVTRGIQSTGCIATLKHYNCKGRQLHRTENNHLVSRRLLMEHYGLAFRSAVQSGGALCVMNAYNLVNGLKCAENPDLLGAILRTQWGFPYYVVSDWGSIWSTERAIRAGCDVCMGSDNYQNDLEGLVRSGVLPESVIDDAVRRVLRTKLVAGLLDRRAPGDASDVNSPAHRRLCLEAGSRSLVLLKNQDNLLPFDADAIRLLAVIGPSADEARTDGTGSSRVWPGHTTTPVEAIRARLGTDRVVIAKGCDINSADTSGFAEARRAALGADAVVFVGGLDETQEGEGLDRVGDSIELPGKQQDLILALARVRPDLAVVLESGGVCGVRRWLYAVKSLVYAFYPGQEGGAAIAGVLFGDVNPGGKLPVTLPKDDAQLPPRNTDFNDDDGCGYRWFDENGWAPQFAFGSGLSYTTFEYTSLEVTPVSVAAGRPVEIAAGIRNTGSRRGDEVVQLYLTDDASSVWMPVKQLKGFSRVTLEPGETRIVRFTLTPDEFYFYDESASAYRIEPGTFTVRVGGASDNLPLSGSFEVTDAPALPDLTVAEVRTIPPVVMRDDRVIFLAVVLNRGTGPTLSGVPLRVSFRVNGRETAWSAAFRGSIPAGGMALVAADGGPSGSNVWRPAAAGSFVVEAAVDPGGAIPEIFESNNSGFGRIEVASSKQANLALGRPVTSTSVEGSGLEASNAVDGDTGTRWASAFSDPQSITVDLGAVRSIDRVTLVWETACGAEYAIETSADGSDWTEAAHVTDGDGGTDEMPVHASGRYVRMTGIRRATQWGYSLYEFEVRADSSGSSSGDGGFSGGTFVSLVFPNPVRTVATVRYGLASASRVRIAIFGASGRLVRTLADADLDAGLYEAEWDGSDDSGVPAAAGVYLLRWSSGGRAETRKLVILR
jgi:beta-glucosidase